MDDVYKNTTNKTKQQKQTNKQKTNKQTQKQKKNNFFYIVLYMFSTSICIELIFKDNYSNDLLLKS